MEVKPEFGIGNIVFGMTVNEVKDKLGNPDKIFSEPDDSNELIYQYNKPKLQLTFFKEEGGKMGYIRSSNPELSYNGKKIINRPVREVMFEVLGEAAENWEIEDNEFFETCFNEKTGVTLNAEYDAVTDLEIGVPFNDAGEFEWKK